jgi:hypothetical protein
MLAVRMLGVTVAGVLVGELVSGCGDLLGIEVVSAEAGAGESRVQPSGTTSGTTTGTTSGTDSGPAAMTCIVDVNCAPPASNRVEVFLSGNPSTNPDAAGWKFNKGDVAGAEMPGFVDSAWTAVSLPYSWNAADSGLRPTGTAANPYLGIGWFRKHYTIPSTMAGERIYIQFDESAYITDVFINGTQVGEHVGGYSRFRFDITSVASVGVDNVIAVKVDNSPAVTAGNIWIGGTNAHTPPLSGDFTLFGGIERDVRILATDNLAITPLDFGGPGVYMNWDATSGMFTAKVRLLNASTSPVTASVKVDILNEDNSVFQSFTGGMQSVPPAGTMGTTADAIITGTVMSPHLWDGLADPYVYHVNITVMNGAAEVRDAIVQPFGFRSYRMDPNIASRSTASPTRFVACACTSFRRTAASRRSVRALLASSRTWTPSTPVSSTPISPC